MPPCRDSGGVDAEEDGPGSLVEKETLDKAISVTKDEEEELEHMFEQVRVSDAKTEERIPKIMLSPREESTPAVSRPLRDKLADGLMPSRQASHWMWLKQLRLLFSTGTHIHFTSGGL